MECLEYYIIKLYEYKKNKSDIKIGINRLSNGKRRLTNILLCSMFVLLILMIFLLFVYPNNFWLLLGLIPISIMMIILTIMDTIDRNINVVQHLEEYNKRINLLYEMLIENFSIDNEDKLSTVISKFQENLDLQNKEDKKRDKIIMSLFTSVSGLITASLDIGVDSSKWLNFIILLSVFASLASFFVFIVFYIKKNLNTKIEKYKLIINDLEYIKLCKF